MISVGEPMPDIVLPATDGTRVGLARLPGRTVAFFYPYTGRPGVADPPGWDDILGAHGSTPQALGYSKLYGEFRKLGVKVFGISLQDTAWQQEFVTRNNLSFSLLSDTDEKLSTALQIQRFSAGDKQYLFRTTLIVNNGVVAFIRKRLAAEEDAEVSLALLKS